MSSICPRRSRVTREARAGTALMDRERPALDIPALSHHGRSVVAPDRCSVGEIRVVRVEQESESGFVVFDATVGGTRWILTGIPNEVFFFKIIPST